MLKALICQAFIRLAAVALLALPLAATGAAAQSLVIATGANATAIDPHFHNTTPNINLNVQIYDRLVHQDARQRPVPGLATAWRTLDDTTWEFTLREGVRFHDGAPFDARDVEASFRRVPAVPNSPSSFASFIAQVAEIETPSPHVIRLRTKGPAPNLINDLVAIQIISNRHETASTADFNAGRAAIGTGPFKVVEFRRGEKLVLERNPDYWAGAPHWARVEMRQMTTDPSRVAALLAGDVDVIEFVPPADLPRIEATAGLRLFRTESNRLLFLSMDHEARAPPQARQRDGAPLDRNPMADGRVRRALALAINRAQIAERLLSGVANPAGQLLPSGFFGTSDRLKPEAADPDRARRLLAEAGFPDGFQLTLHGPNDRYVEDERVLQALAQQFQRVGIQVKVEAMPWSVYVGRANRREFSAMYFGWGSATGEASSPLRALIHRYDRARGLGASNRGRYANPRVDALIGQALGTIDDAQRARLFAEATEIALADDAIIPLFHQVGVWAAKATLALEPRADEQTHARTIRLRD
jgi:peptide/nickel transport system substrate-binding protein